MQSQDMLEVSTTLPGKDLDFLPTFARQQGYGSSDAGAMRFATGYAARMLRAEQDGGADDDLPAEGTVKQ